MALNDDRLLKFEKYALTDDLFLNFEYYLVNTAFRGDWRSIVKSECHVVYAALWVDWRAVVQRAAGFWQLRRPAAIL